MRYVDEFHDSGLASKIVKAIDRLLDQETTLMEVCGTHTMAIFRHGIRDLLPKGLTLLSGPGCPVCVTPVEDVDFAIEVSKEADVILVTFGDMMKVRGSKTSLEKAHSDGRDIRVVYSPVDALKMALANPKRKVIFFGVGFETTSPTIASTILMARKKKINNFWVYSCHKLIPQALNGLLKLGEVKVDGLILPGHVSTIIGSDPYEFIARDYGIACVISGFEPLDILQSIYMLVRQIKERRPRVEIQYSRSVKPEGNKRALSRLYEVFEVKDSNWRGIGLIPGSGLRIKDEYKDLDAAKYFKITLQPIKEEKDCICGRILRGLSTPYDCPLFAKLCRPEEPVGPCMVSSEGSCAAYYKYDYRH